VKRVLLFLFFNSFVYGIGMTPPAMADDSNRISKKLFGLWVRQLANFRCSVTWNCFLKEKSS